MSGPKLRLITAESQRAENGAKEKRRRKGERKDGLVAVYGTYGKDSKGKRIRKAFYGKCGKEAEAKKKEYERRLGFGVSPEDMVITVSVWCDRWLEVYKTELHGKNRESYVYATNKVKASIGHMKVRDVTEVTLQSFLNTFAGMSDSYISKMRFILKNIFHRAQKNRIIDDNPASDLKRPQGTEGTHRALTLDEIALLTNSYDHYRFGLAAMIMLYAGLRRGELIALQWKHIDLDKGFISVEESVELVTNQPTIKDGGKSEASVREIPICKTLMDALMMVSPQMRKGFVCMSAKSTVHTATSFRQAIKSYARQLELSLNRYAPTWKLLKPGDRKEIKEKKEKCEWKSFELRSHDLRHTFATGMYDAGVDIKSAQYYLGHKDIKTTMNLYTHLSEEKKAQSRIVMVGFLDKWTHQIYEKNEQTATDILLPTHDND